MIGASGAGSLAFRMTEKTMGGQAMMIARWTCEAHFGRKAEAIELLKEWGDEIGSQTDIDMKAARTITGSVGAKEAVIQDEFEIKDLAELDAFFDKIASIEMHAEWGRKMGDVIVSGSTFWEVFRIVD